MLRIKEVIKEKGLTVKEIAKKLGMTSPSLSDAINGNPTVEKIERIAAAIGVPVAELFEQTKIIENTSTNDFRQKIKDICRNKGIAQKDLADKLGITDMSLNKTLRGKYPQLQTLEKIAVALGVDISELFAPKKSTEKHQNTFVCPKCGTALTISKSKEAN